MNDAIIIPGSQWPPPYMAALWRQMATMDAWWTGDPDRLRSTYQHTGHNRPSQYAGGLVGAVSRFFWGRPTSPESTTRQDLHLPVASDIARTSAELLYAEPPDLTADGPAQDHIDAMIEDGLFERLLEGAEIGAAFGGRFHRVTVDPAINNGAPFITTHSPDEVIPTFTWGRLTGATIVHTLTSLEQPNVVWRHMEHHSLDGAGNGRIVHDLWKGSYSNLGTRVPLTDRLETASLKVNANGEWEGSRTPGLAVVYVPNMLPQRLNRRHPAGRNLGRPDIEGLTGLMDALDEAWTSWMRDLRLGRARIIAARSILDNGYDGQPFTLDLDQEVFTPVDTLDRGDGGLPIKDVQFQIRVTEHQSTCTALTEQIIALAGYSLGSFQETQDTDITATEVRAREKRSITTRGRKLPHEKRALTLLLRKALSWAGVPDAQPKIEFPDAVTKDPMSEATTLAALAGARLMSREIAVRTIHPDWDDTQVAEEIQRINTDEDATTVLDDPDSWRPTATAAQEDGDEQ